MNWTGGHLQRSRHVGSSVSVLQKDHFIKARNRLQNGPPTTSPLKFPVFEIAKDEERGLPEYGPLLASEGRKHRTQKTLEEHRNTAPLVKRLGSIKRCYSPDDARPLQSHDQRHRSRISSHGDNPTRHPRAVTTKIESKGPGPERSLEAKRRELLQRQDWLGAAISKPLKMEFVEDKDCERIGKRRRLRADEHQYHRGIRYRTPVPAVDERANIDSRPQPPYHLHHDTISVRVGTSIHGSQGTREEKDPASQQSRQSDFSDPMLLDEKEVTQRNYHSSWVPTPLDLEICFSVDAPLSMATDTRMPICEQTFPPLSSPDRECDDHLTRLLSLPLACSSPRKAAVISENIKKSNSFAAVNVELATQANSKPYSDGKAGSGEAIGRLIFASSSPHSNRSCTPSATVEVASRINPGVDRSGIVPQANSEVENRTNDACWKKFVDISGSSVLDQHIDTSPLSKATLQDLAALQIDGSLNKNSFLPWPTTAHPEPKCARNPDMIQNRKVFVPKSERGGSNNTNHFRDEDSVWRDFDFGYEMSADGTNTHEQGGHNNDAGRSRSKPSASSVVVQASSEDAEATISTGSSSGDSPSSNLHLGPALPQIVETSSPDPLHLDNSSSFIDPKQMRRLPSPRLLFTKPAPFVGKRATGDASTFFIGHQLRSNERLEDDKTTAAREI